MSLASVVSDIRRRKRSYVLFIGRNERASFTTLAKAKSAARDDSHNNLKWQHVIYNPGKPEEEELYISDDRQEILVRYL